MRILSVTAIFTPCWNCLPQSMRSGMLSFGSEGYIAFDDDTSPNFLGYELTPAEFMETDFTQSDDEDMDEDEDETQTIQMGGISQ